MESTENSVLDTSIISLTVSLSADQTVTSNSSKSNLIKFEESPEINDILNHIVNSSAVFQSQQIGDPDLSSVDKRDIAKNLLFKNPATFLSKFGKFLLEEHLPYFLKKYHDSYEVQFYIKHIKTLLNDKNQSLVKRNRRYEAMMQMEAEGSYFSETEMQKREPLLYYEMVGQYLTEKEKLLKLKEAQKNKIPTFSSFIIEKIEKDELDDKIKILKKEEEKEISSESDSELVSESEKQVRWGEDWEEKVQPVKKKKKKPKKVCLSARDKALLFQEFKSIMQNRFLNGKDDEFNYSDVDCNPEYDSIDLRSRDEEEKYFDEESLDNTVCTDTGIEDY